MTYCRFKASRSRDYVVRTAKLSNLTSHNQSSEPAYSGYSVWKNMRKLVPLDWVQFSTYHWGISNITILNRGCIVVAGILSDFFESLLLPQ